MKKRQERRRSDSDRGERLARGLREVIEGRTDAE